MNEISLKKITPDESNDVGSMARRIWPKAYQGIISEEQIEYMLGWMYSPEMIKTEISEHGIEYHWMRCGDEIVGFLAVGPILREKPAMLHKCYLLNEKHGQGLGTEALQTILKTLVEAGVSELQLRVNRHNTAAISFYKKNGFRVVGEDVAEIGCGYKMDDYLMSRAV